MAQRHEIQNLVRRGNVFYWRPRIPRRFVRVPDSHLSLSLHQSCHMKAGYMARRLNTLLHEMKMKPVAALTTKDQLEALFRAEAARMADHLDNLQFAARRVGADPLLALRADLEVGWAYRLIELFGTLRRLDFKSGCAGRKVLEREGIPEASIAVIAETFAQEQAECRRAPFENALRADMAAHGIPDTLVNRERTTAELMRARADMLLASPARYPEAEGLGMVDILGGDDDTPPLLPRGISEAAASGEATPEARAIQDLPVGPDATLEARSESNGREAVSMPPVPRTDSAVAVAAAGQEGPPTTRAAVDSSKADASPRPAGKPLPILEFGEKCESLINSKRTWETKTAQDVRVVVETFAAILAEHAVHDVSEIEQFHVGRLREHFDMIPARYGQSARMRKLSPRELREAAARQVAGAKERNQPAPHIGLSTNTIRKHLGNLAEFFRYLRGHGYALRELTMDGLRPPKLKASDIRTLTQKPDPDRLRPMFRIPLFTGCLDAEHQALPGEQVYHSANYFVPMLLTYLGARRNEITGLAVRDVSETLNGWAIYSRASAQRTRDSRIPSVGF